MRLRPATGIVLAAWIVMVSAAGTAEPISDREIADAVNLLGSRRLADRREAESTLIAAGPGVLEHLPEPESLVEPAQQHAVRRIRQQLERQVIRELQQPTRVSFQGRGTLAELVQEIARQTGNEVRIAAEATAAREAQFTVDWQQATFWGAIEELSQRSRLQVTKDAHSTAVELITAPDENAASETQLVATSTAYLLRVQPLSGTRSKTSDNASRLFRLRLELLAEPRLHPVFLAVREQELRVQVDRQPLEPLNPLAVREIEFTRQGTAVFDIAYHAPQVGDAPEIRMDGSFDVELAALTRELRFDGLDGPLPMLRRHGSAAVAVEEIADRPATNSAEVQLTLRYSAGGPVFESHRLNGLIPPAVIHWPDGGEVRASAGPELTREQDGAIGLRYRFEVLPRNWRSGTLVFVATVLLSRSRVQMSTGDNGNDAERSLDAAQPEAIRAP